MFDWLLEPLSSPLMLPGLVQLVLGAIAAGPLGVWVILKRESYSAEAMAHGMLPGLVLAGLVGVSLFVGAVVAVIVTAVAVALVSSHKRVGSDAAVAIVTTGLVGLGALLALSAQVPVHLDRLLFGHILGSTSAEIVQTGVVAMIVCTVLVWQQRSLTVSAFDPQLGGGKNDRIVLSLLIALTTVATVGALGSLLLVALILAPAAAARCLTTRLIGMLVVAPVVAVIAGSAGLLISYHLKVGTSPAVAGCCLVSWLMAWAARGAAKRISLPQRTAEPVQSQATT